MRVASLCPFPIGVVKWHSPEPSLTVVVKATYALHPDREATLAPEQEPLFGDEPMAAGDPELYRASDFAPWKSAADILVVGHARASEPTYAVAVQLQVDGWSKRCFAVAGAESTAVPLLSTYLRTSPSGGEQLRLGPVAAAVRGWASRSVSRSFDFSQFNVAPPDQRVPWLKPDAQLMLEGLLSGGARCLLTLPGVQPTVFFVPSAEPGIRWVGVEMVADTLWLDIDRAICTLTWRGVHGLGASDYEQGFVVLAQNDGSGATAESLAAQLPSAGWIEAMSDLDVADVDVDGDPSGGSEDESDATLVGAFVHTGPPLPFRRIDPNAPPPPATKPWLRSHETLEFVPTDGMFGDWPFQQSGSEPQPQHESPGDDAPEPPTEVLKTFSATLLDVEASPGDPLPFQEAEPGKLPPRLLAALMRLDAASAGGTAVVDDALDEPTLPFQTAASAAAPRAILPRPPAPLDARPLAESPSSPASSPAAPPIEPQLSIEIYGKVKAALMDADGATTARLLESHDISKRDWRAHDRRMTIALAREAAQGKSELATELRGAIAAARREVSPVDADADDDELGLDEYVALKAELDEADDAHQTLAELGLSAADWEGIRRPWIRRALADRQLAAVLRSKLVEARRALRSAKRGGQPG